MANNIYLNHFEDALEYGFLKYDHIYHDKNAFKLYEKYSREDVLRLLNWKHFMNGQNIGGYKIKYNTCPIFVTYDKKEDISETINYEDHFIDKQTFNWMSRNNRKTSSQNSNRWSTTTAWTLTYSSKKVMMKELIFIILVS